MGEAVEGDIDGIRVPAKLVRCLKQGDAMALPEQLTMMTGLLPAAAATD